MKFLLSSSKGYCVHKLFRSKGFNALNGVPVKDDMLKDDVGTCYLYQHRTVFDKAEKCDTVHCKRIQTKGELIRMFWKMLNA